MARELRNNPTTSEKKLWTILRRRQLLGYKFLRQKPIIYEQKNYKTFFFIADFYCAKMKLVIEVDGKYHNYNIEYDQNRDLVIKKLELKVLRIKNSDLKNTALIKKKITAYLE